MAPEAVFAHPLIRWLALVVAAAVLVEALWLVATRARRTPWLELSADLFTFFVGEGLRFATRGVFVLAAVGLGRVAPWRLETTALTATVCFLVVDLVLYLWHRVLHHLPLGWALHSVHHTGEAFALPLAGRLPWPLRVVDDLVVVPLALLGFAPQLLVLCLAVSFTVQVLAHAGFVGRLGPLDLVFNTPSNHRVHHHAEGPGQRHNYGAALIVWDRLFGTWQREAGPAAFGVSGVPTSVNPFVIQAQGLASWWRTRRGG